MAANDAGDPELRKLDLLESLTHPLTSTAACAVLVFTSIVVRNVCRDGEEFVPFSIFRKIILELLVQKDAEENEVEDDSSLDISALTFDDASMVEGNTSDAIQLQRLKSLCAEMNYSDGIAIWLGYHLFDLSLNMEKDMLVTDDSKISPEEAVAFVSFWRIIYCFSF